METLCYLLLVSFVCVDHLESPFVDAVLATQERGHAVKNAHPDTLFELKGLVGHKMNRWCES